MGGKSGKDISEELRGIFILYFCVYDFISGWFFGEFYKFVNKDSNRANRQNIVIFEYFKEIEEIVIYKRK
jgi:hypothetical protein